MSALTASDSKHAGAATMTPAVAGNPRFPLFDGLRAIAALSIVLSHVTVQATGFGSRLSNALTVGVTIFFVISGFLLYRPFVLARTGHVRRPTTGGYLARRALRVVPGYWVALTALAVFPGLVMTEPRITYYLFGQSYFPDALTGLPVAWSLSAEVAFYLALPVLDRLLRRMGKFEPLALMSTVPLTLGFLGWLFHGGHDPSWIARNAHWKYSILGTFDWFALGMLLAWISVGGVTRIPRVVIRSSWAIAGAILVVAVIGPLVEIADHLLFALVAVAFALPAVTNATETRQGKVLAHPVARWLGLISYGMFLWHLPLIVVLRDHGVNGAGLLVTGLGAAIASGAGSYYLVEAPFVRMKPRTRRPST